MAADNVSVDAVLADAVSKLDALGKRMDALEVGEKNIIKGDDDDDDDRKDSAKKADAKKADGMSKPKSVIKDSKKADDDDDDKRDDDDDDDDRKDSAKKSDDDDDRKDDAFPPPKGKRDDDGELEIKHGGKEEKDDSRRRDSKGKRADAKKADDDDDKKDDDDDDKKRDDDDDDDRRDDKRADSIANLRREMAELRATNRRLEALMKPRSDDEHAAFADAQAKADSIFIGLGQRAPRPMEGEELGDYRRRLASKLKNYSTAWKSVKLTKLPNEAFDIAEGQIYADATTAAANPTDLGEGELRMVSRQDPATGLRTNYFYGKESFVKQMGRPGRRVAAFRTMAST